ncbi:MAG: branched-chain amino acid ABC transporter permease [Firmicutes bacterium]|jgi:branched-chain amino acid transport system permease protein|nr:branched-chain amino acid ABC transporter permease [Bacillota bacterium]
MTDGAGARRWDRAGIGLLLLAALAFPLVFTNAAITTYAIFTLMWVAIASAWNILSGFSGYVSLGHAAFYGIGGYALALMAESWHLTTGGYATFAYIPLAGFIAAVFALPIGWIALRTRKHSFVVITIAFIFLLQLLAFNLQGITAGSTGLPLPTPPWTGAFFNVPFYYATLVLAVAAVGVAAWVRRSKFGLGLLAIRDDEDRALGFGVPTGVYKLAAFVLSAFFIGMAGALDGYFSSYVYPQFAFNPQTDITMAAMSFFGGLGSVAGPIVGAVVLEPVQQLLSVNYADLALVVFGLVLLAVIVFLPAGVVPTLSAWARQRAARSAPTGETGAPAEALAPIRGVGESS